MKNYLLSNHRFVIDTGTALRAYVYASQPEY